MTHNKCIKCNSTCNGMFALLCFSDTFNFISSFHKIFLFRLYALPPPPTTIIPQFMSPPKTPYEVIWVQGQVPERPISAKNGRINFFSTFCIYRPMHCLEQNFVLSFPFFEVKTQQYFVVDQFRFLGKYPPTPPPSPPY